MELLEIWKFGYMALLPMRDHAVFAAIPVLAHPYRMLILRLPPHTSPNRVVFRN